MEKLAVQEPVEVLEGNPYFKEEGIRGCRRNHNT